MLPERSSDLSDRLRHVTHEQMLAALVATILTLGLYGWWREKQRAEIADQMFQDLMGHGTEIHGPDPLIYLLYTAMALAFVAGIYLVGLRRQTNVATGEAATSPDQKEEPVKPRENRKPSPLDLLPDDERRILDPVLGTPGLTQVELRDRSDFSKSKVSQALGKLESRGLVYREPQGRTYRVYPGELIKVFTEN